MSWKKQRLKELSKSAWMWCENNGKTEYCEKSKEPVVDFLTMNMVTDGFSVAECIFQGNYKSNRLRRHREQNNLCIR